MPSGLADRQRVEPVTLADEQDVETEHRLWCQVRRQSQ